jgi:hypothetical protein
VDEADIGLRVMQDSNLQISLNGSENVPEDSFIESDISIIKNKNESNPKQFDNKRQ